MKTTFENFIAIRDSLTNLQAVSKVKLRTAYEISRFMSSTETDLQFYISKLNEILQNYAEKNENGELIIDNDSYTIKKQFLEECNNEMNQLNSLEIEISLKIWIDDFENIYINPIILRPLIPFIIDYN